jgi:antitoxin ParD1/3/4
MISLGPHFEKFIADQIAEGRYRSESDVIRAGLELLELDQASDEAWLDQLRLEIDQAWNDPTPSRPATEVFARLETLHSETVRARDGND